MKKAFNISYIIICFVICILPFAGMVFWQTDTTTENKELAKFPVLWENETWNVDFLQELGTYFEEHFAFRQELVSADAEIQSHVFGVPNVDTVVAGKDGWLYYTDTVDDYLGQDLMSERSIYNAVHNLELIRQYVEENGARFLLTVAPNKNSLYGENMPYYLQQKAGEEKNIDMLIPALSVSPIAYADLFAAFESQPEVLYLKRDSHWNQRGAVLAYNAIMDGLEMEHETYETTDVLRLKEEYGDLNRMLYPFTAEPEWNYYYQKEPDFSYVTDTESVEDAWIETENPKGTGSVLMFRDSFGNTLLPLVADTFEKGYFTKSVPYNITEYMEAYEPEVVIIEKVERNIDEFAEIPPLVAGMEIVLPEEPEAAQSNTTITMSESENNTSYWSISGILDQQYGETKTNIYIRISAGEEQQVYEAFLVTTEESDYGYQLYLPKDMIHAPELKLEVLVESENGLQLVQSADVKLEELLMQ